jgi:glycosyltransferase involved in cell wall biosynthesis
MPKLRDSATGAETASTPVIAIYMHTLYNGGIERVMMDLMHGFLDRGIAVDLVLDFLFYSPFEKLVPTGVSVVNLGAVKSSQRLPRFIGYLRRRRPQAILSATHLANEIACIARRVSGSSARLVVTEHSNLSSDIETSSSSARKLLIPRTTRLLYPWADAAVAVSNGVADDLCRTTRLPRNLVQTIYNPIDFERLGAMGAEPCDHPWFSPGQPPVILAIGRLEKQKNFACLLKAFAIVRRERSARLLILGEGSLREALSKMVTDLGLEGDVLLPGFVENPAKYMSRASIFTMSSLWEGMPVALIEALSLGLPVVSTDCPSGPTEVLDGGKYGELVPMDDSQALADAIARVLDGERKPSAAEWLKQFDSDTIAAKYTALLLPDYFDDRRHDTERLLTSETSRQTGAMA